nr:hypothetical protein [Tanacetum cinerariifolium]
MDKLPDDMIGLRAIPNAMAWRHHDSDINDLVPKDGFSAQNVQTLAERDIDLRPVPSGLLFQGGLATTWDFPGFRPIFKDSKGNVVTMSEYLRFPFLSGATIEKENALTNQDQREKHTVHPLLVNQAIPDKTDHQKEVEVEDPNIVATYERKARVAAKKREKKKRGADEGDGSRAHTDEGESSRDQAYYVPEWFIHQRCRMDNPICCRELMVHLAPSAAQEKSNALDNYTTLERAWFALGQGALAQADMLERFENLHADYNSLAETHAECGNTVWRLLEAREASQQSSRLYLEMSEWFKKPKNDHAGCTEQIQLLRGLKRKRDSSLSLAN